MANEIKVIIKRPDEDGHVAWIPNTLKAFQSAVDGYIETWTVLAEKLVVICNEEGLIRGLPFNCVISNCPFYGTIVLAGIDGEEFSSIPEELTLEFFKERMVDHVLVL